MACSGSSSNYTVALTNVTTSTLTTGTTIKFSINNLFSPPTTEQADSITLISYSGGYQIDSSAALVSGLTPKNMSLAISAPNSSFTINTAVTIQFDFVLADTISKSNYLVLQFPSGTVFQYMNFYSTLVLNATSIVYNSSSLQLVMYQSSSATNRNSGTAVTLRVQSYTTPSSVRTTDLFYLRIKSGSGDKMVGSSSINILPKSYTATATTANTLINSVTSYTISLAMTDAISSSGYFLVVVPP